MNDVVDWFTFEFTRCYAGWIEFVLGRGDVKLEYCFSEAFDATKDFVLWIEDIAQGKFREFCADAEGWFWYLNYDGRTFVVSDTRNLNGDNPTNAKIMRLAFYVDRIELCKKLYQTFRKFVLSDLYVPHEWEGLNFKRIVDKCYGPLDGAAEKLSAMTLQEIIADIAQKNIFNDFPYDALSFFEDESYGKQSADGRKKLILEYYQDNDYVGYGGLPLREIKSDLLERMLLEERQEWRWALVGNIVGEHEFGEEHEVRRGTKQFRPGAKVYCSYPQWGDGYENIVVIGKPRKKNGYIEIIMPSKLIENFRLQKVYKPAVLKRMRDENGYGFWGNTDEDKEEILEMLKWLNPSCVPKGE